MLRSFKSILFGASIFASLLVMAAPASADVIVTGQIDFTGTGKVSQVTIGGTNRSGTFLAGELNWAWLGTTPEGWARSFYSYCIDVSQNLRDPQTVSVVDSTGFTNGVANGASKAAWLFNQYAATVHATAGALGNTMAAALQLAIWEAMYDSSANLNQTSGPGNNFYVTGATVGSAIKTQAEIYLSALYSSPTGPYNTGLATVLSTAVGQDQITTRVSEPSTILFMGVAFLLFANLVRRNTPITER